MYPNQGWDAAGAKDNQDDKNYLNWALALIRDLFFPGKKPKEIIEQGGKPPVAGIVAACDLSAPEAAAESARQRAHLRELLAMAHEGECVERVD